jgi:hypothetical protein
MADSNHSNRMIPKRRTVYKSRGGESDPLIRGAPGDPNSTVIIPDRFDPPLLNLVIHAGSFTKREISYCLEVIGPIGPTGRRGPSIARSSVARTDFDLEPLASRTCKFSPKRELMPK